VNVDELLDGELDGVEGNENIKKQKR